MGTKLQLIYDSSPFIAIIIKSLFGIGSYTIKTRVHGCSCRYYFPLYSSLYSTIFILPD